MEKTDVSGAVLEFEVTGSGEPLLLISTGPIADSFLPFAADKALHERFMTITYHQRGQVGSSRADGRPVPFETHAADAAALLQHLGVARAHVAGHSTGAAIALELAVRHPRVVHSLLLLEPPLPAAPSAGSFFDKAAPAFAAYQAGNKERAMSLFLSAVSGLDESKWSVALEKLIPGARAQAVTDADTFFAGYLVALQGWRFGAEEAAAIRQPVLSVVGAKTDPFFLDGHRLLQSWLSRVEELVVPNVGHLLHMQRADGIVSDITAWLRSHPIASA